MVYRLIFLISILTLVLSACAPSELPPPPTPSSTHTPQPAPSTTESPTDTPIRATETLAPATPTSTNPGPSPSPIAPLDGRGGGLVAFYSERDGNPEIYLMNADGTGNTRLTDHPSHDVCPAISPDGSQIAFITSRHDPAPTFPFLKYELYIMDIDGENLLRLTTTEAAETHPAWSPDGEWISFDADYDGDGFGEIYIIRPDGTDLTRLTDNQANDQFADWSPDGTQIAFSSDREGNFDIFVMQVDGDDQRQVTTSPEMEVFPAWSPDGSQIAYAVAYPGSRRADVFVMNSDGNEIQQLTDEPGYDEGPAWSPDGEFIIFQSDRDYHFELYTMRPDGSDVQRLTHTDSDNFWPHWGASTGPSSLEPGPLTTFTGIGEIVFASHRDGNWNLYSIDPDGSNLQRLTDDPANDRHPKWSPDGGSILFTSTRDGNTELYLLDARDGSLTRLTDTPIDELYPAWSPYGDQITFTSDHDGDEEIYLMKFNQEIPITDLESYQRLTENEIGDWWASWSPDGKTIAFVSNRDGNDELYIMELDSREEIRLTDNPGWDYDPIWSPNGSQFAFTSKRDDKYLGIFTLEVTGTLQIEGHRLTPLTSARYRAEHCPVWSPDMDQIAFITDRDGSFDIFIIEFGGEDPRKLIEHHGNDMCPDWRPEPDD